MRKLWWGVIIGVILVVVVPVAVGAALVAPFFGIADDIAEMNTTADELTEIIAMFREMPAAAAFIEGTGNVHNEDFTESFPGDWVYELSTDETSLRIEYDRDTQEVTDMVYICATAGGGTESFDLHGGQDIAAKIRSGEC